jgi:spermidine synthase
VSAALLGLSFLSGAAGLVFEVLWARRLALLFGGTAPAQALALAAFLGGLAAGGARLGRAADRADSPLKFYARLEWLVAALGSAAPLLLFLCDGPVMRWFAVAGTFAQAYAMGGALPALCRAAGGETQPAVARMYASNAAGAALGALAAGFLLIPFVGLQWSFAVAAALNALAGLVAWNLRAASPSSARPAAVAGEPFPRTLVFAAVFLSGFVALTYEIAWTRVLALALGSSAYSFAEMLAAFVCGVSLGGALAGWGPLRRMEPARLLGWAELGAGLSVLFTLPLYDRLPYAFFAARPAFGSSIGGFYGFEAFKFLLCLLLMLAPTAFLGMALPPAVRLAERSGARGDGTGSVLAWNAAGNVLGALAGLLFLPWLGLEGVLRSGTTVHLAVGAGILLWSCPPLTRRARALAWAALASVVAYRAWLPRWDLRALSQGVFRDRGGEATAGFAGFESLFARDRLTFYRDDREATVSLMRYENGILGLKVNGKTDASSGDDMATQVLLGELPMLLAPDAKRVLVVGWGSGVTVGSVLRHPVAHVDAVELIPSVVDASRAFDGLNGGALSDPRLRLHLEDAKTFLRRPGEVYDAIVNEPSNPWMAGVGDLFSTEFYARARSRLAPGGLMVQWFHLYEMDDPLLREVLRTFTAAFPHAALWNIGDSDAILVGSDAPLAPDFAAMESAYARSGVREDLARAHARYLSTVLGFQSAGGDSLRALGGAGPVNSEMRPTLEYGAPIAYFRGAKARSPREHDDRVDDARAADLLLARYLKARGRPLTRPEFIDWVATPHVQADAPVLLRSVADWLHRFPKDKDVAQLLKLVLEMDRTRSRGQ